MVPESADTLIGAYSETSGIPAQQYARAVEDGYLYGSVGLRMENIPRGSDFWGLSESQRKLAYELGATVRAEKDTAREQEIERLKTENYRSADENENVLSMIDKVNSGEAKGNEKVYLGTISASAAAEIQNITGINVDGFKVAIEARQIEHILKRHGEKGTSDKSMADPTDIAKIEYTLDHYDDIRPAGQTRAYKHFVNGKTEWTNTVLYEKEIGEKSYYVVQAVPDTKAKTLYIVTAFIGKQGYMKEASQFIDAQSPDATPKSEIASTSTHSIPDPAGNVNSSSKNNSKEAKAEAMRDAEEALTRTNDENMQVTDNSEEHSVSEKNKAYAENFQKRIDAWDGKTDGFAFVLGETPSYLSELEVNGKRIGKKQIRIDATKIKKIMRDHPEMTTEVIKNLPYLLNDPILVLDSKTVGGRLVVLGEIYAKGRPVIVVLEINPTTRRGNSSYVDVIKVASAYARKDTQNLLNSSNVRYINENKSRVDDWLKVNRLQLPLPNSQSNSATNSIPDSNANVNSNSKNDSKDVAEKISEAISKTEKTTRKEGTVTVKADESTLSERQKVSVACLRSLAKAIGVNFVVENLSTRTRMGRVGENGRFDRKTNTVYLDLNAGNDGEGVILYTASHELTHFIAKWSPKKYKILRETLFDFYGKTNKDVIAMAREQMAAAKEAGHPITFDAAIEEVVADAMERMLTDGNAQKILTEIEKKDKSLFEKIKSYFAELLAKIRKAYEGAAFQSDEAQFLHESAEAVERVQALFFDALSDASETYREIGNGKENSQMSVDSESFSVRRSEQDSEISNADVELVRSIGEVRGRISINNFTSEEIQKAEKWARKFYAELGTKSPFFRAWFGDWRARDATPLKIANIDKNAKPSSGNTINKDTGRKFSWSTEVAKESIINSPKAYKSDISYISANINLVVENAVLLDTVISSHKSKRKLPGSTWMHSLYSLVDIDGKISLIKLFAEEAYSAKSNDTFTRAYSLKYIEKVAEIDRGVHSENGGLTDSHSTTVYSISDLFDFVKRYDTEFSPKSVNPSMLNPDGTPKVVYHQTGARFSIFNTDNPVAGLNDSETPNGIFFKDNDHDIGLQGKMQMAVYLNARSILHFANREEANRWYRKNVDGYDALHKEYDRAMEAFNPRFAEIEKEQFDPSTTDERQDELDQMEDELIAELSKVENDYRIRLRERLNDYFLDGKSGYDCIELDYDGHRWVGGKRENVHTYIVFDKKKIKSATDNIGTFDGSNPDIRYSVRKSNRSTLTAALDSVVTDPEERRILDVYRANIENLDAQQERLQELNAEIKLLSFSDGEKDRATLLRYITRLAQRMKDLKLHTYQNATQDQSK